MYTCGQITRDYIVSNEYGDLISSYVPIYDSEGKVVAVLGCDYDASDIKAKLGIITAICVGCAAGFLVIAAAIVYLSQKSQRILFLSMIKSLT